MSESSSNSYASRSASSIGINNQQGEVTTCSLKKLLADLLAPYLTSLLQR